MLGNRKPIAVILLCLVLSLALTTSIVSAQDTQSDRRSIQVMFVLGGTGTSVKNESFSSTQIVLSETSPDKGLNLDLTLRSSLASEHDLIDVELLIIGLPDTSTIPNATVVRAFLDRGGSLFLLSNYYGGGTRNSSYVLNGIMNKTYAQSVSFGTDAIFISNTTLNWQEKVYNNNTFAVRVNSSMFRMVDPVAEPILGTVGGAVIISCSLNITDKSDPNIVGFVSAQSNSSTPDWLLLLDNGSYRIALCGSASMFNDTYLDVESNRFLFRNIILWLAQKFQSYPSNVFQYIAIASSAVLVCGIVVYLMSKKQKT